MDSIDALIDLVDRYREARSVSDARVSTLVFNDGQRIAQIKQGHSDVGVRRLERAVQWFSDHWPEGAVWPAGVPRPRQHTPTSHTEQRCAGGMK